MSYTLENTGVEEIKGQLVWAEAFLDALDVVQPKNDLTLADMLDIMASDEFVLGVGETADEDPYENAEALVSSMESFGHEYVTVKNVVDALNTADDQFFLHLVRGENIAAASAYGALIVEAARSYGSSPKVA